MIEHISSVLAAHIEGPAVSISSSISCSCESQEEANAAASRLRSISSRSPLSSFAKDPREGEDLRLLTRQDKERRMGATQSQSAWCCGNGNGGDGMLLPGKRRSSKEQNGRAAPLRPKPKPSRPQAIKVQTPAYSEGGFENKYEMIGQIGHGSTSVVYRCQDKRKGKLYACKIIDRRLIESKRNELLQQFQARSDVPSIWKMAVEVQVLQSMHHPNIIHIEDVYLSETKICMVTEYMDGGELFDYIVEKGTLLEVEASSFVRKITSAVAYMHACGVIHRDLKPENLMLTSKSPHAEVKIIDFGLAKLLEPDDTTESFLGTRGYLAPEMLQRKAYTMSVDIWALGVIVYILLCGCLPFNDDGARITNENAARAKFGLRFPRWASGLSESAKDLLRHLLEVDASKRYTAEQALAHPWVTGQQTPNKFLRSPNYLATIKKERAAARGRNGANNPSSNASQTSNANGNGHVNNTHYDDQDSSNRINARRQSH